MASVHDVAKYILSDQGELDTWKLQKLVYYSQSWHLVWDEEPLFTNRIEAWANGPVVPALYREHRGSFRVSTWPQGRVGNLTRAQRESIDVVLEHYGRFTGYTLREMTHRERPWREARQGVPAGAASTNEITRDSMQSYYGSL
jgi:uncharacterized phage-associated protein